MSFASPAYGRRGRLGDANTGIRPTAPTFGKKRFGSHSDKATGHYNVESDAERCVSHLLTVDPRVKAFQPQPFSVDLIDQRMLFSKEALHEALRKHRHVPGPKIYTADFSVDWIDGMRYAVEVKLEGYEGDETYWDKVERARRILAANNYLLLTALVPKSTAHPIRANGLALKQAKHQISTHLNDGLVERVTRYCEDGPVTLREVCVEFELTPGQVAVLLVSGVLAGNLASQRINGELVLSAAYGDLSHLYLLEAVQR